jgi:hypothetical protein
LWFELGKKVKECTKVEENIHTEEENDYLEKIIDHASRAYFYLIISIHIVKKVDGEDSNECKS